MARGDRLYAGQAVRVNAAGRDAVPKATIERVHRCWHEYKPVGFADPNGRRWEQSQGYDAGSGKFVATHYVWTLTDDDQPVTGECNDSGDAIRPDLCIHVRYRNNHRAVVHAYAVHPMNAVEELAGLASDFPSESPGSTPSTDRGDQL